MDKREQINCEMEHLFRAHYRALIAILTAKTGPASLSQVEDAVGEALTKALKQWPFQGVPQQPRAWLLTVARNVLLDQYRRQTTHQRHENQTKETMEGWMTQNIQEDPSQPDDELAMIFMACHPNLPAESRVALTLKVVGGFSVEEIAAGFLAKKSNIAQKLVRAKRVLSQGSIHFGMPEPDQMLSRLNSVLDVLYLMFTQGHLAYEGKAVIRKEICNEAIRLGQLLWTHKLTRKPSVAALCALMNFTAARFPERTNLEGDILLLADQDRGRWSKKHLALGLQYLKRSASGEDLTAYHLEAEIAANHSFAQSFAATNWSQLLHLYDLLMQVRPTPVIALNRLVVLEQVQGPERALSALMALNDPSLFSYYPYFVMYGKFCAQTGKVKQAREYFKKALTLCKSQPVQRYLLDQLSELGTSSVESPLPE